MLTPLVLAGFSGGILWAILGISFLIFIHEYGHYSACRLTGTRTEAFSVGFGPRLFGWESAPGHPRRFTLGRRLLGDVPRSMDFRVALIPLGGYVKMAGENPGEERTGAPDEFASKTIPQRLLIVSAGVIMNAITAFVFYAVCYGGGQEKEAPLVGDVVRGGPAWAAGIGPGDRVLEIDGAHIDSFTDLRMEAAFLARDQARTVRVDDGTGPRDVKVEARYAEDQGVVKLGIAPAEAVTLGKGAEAFTIGPREPVDVAGIRVVGGTAALAAIGDAFESGLTEVPVTAGDGRSTAVRLTGKESGAEPLLKKPVKRVGLVPHAPPRVDRVRGSAAGVLRPGDVLRAALVGEGRVDLAVHEAWESLPRTVGKVDAVLLTRDGEEQTVELLAAGADRTALARFVADVSFEPRGTKAGPLAAGRLTFDGPVALRYAVVPAAGKVAPGETLVKVAGKDVSTWAEAVQALGEAGAEGPVRLSVRALDGAEREEVLEPAALEEVGALELSLARAKEPLVSTGFFDAVGLGAGRLWREVKNTFRTIGAFFTGNIAFSKNIAGPITLVGASSRASEESFLDLLWFLAYVSVMLAVLNILPIPILDGGHVVFLIAEKLRGGRPLPDRVIGHMQLVGLILLLTLMFFAIKNDILLNFF
jgi:regulator of sigma E protease